MATVQNQYASSRDDIHMRDYRHAKNLFNEYGLAFAPKTKFLYHCLFEPSPEVGNSGTVNAFAFQKQIGVLVKSADLPSFRVNVQNKKQYNRVKQFQTNIDYNDVNITFHDDNLGVTRALFEEYYKYYWLDGRHNVQKNALVAGPYATRDKYAESVPKYGLDNGTTGPFFTSITIYQLSRQQYFAYTLVNPIISQWNHGGVDAADGAGLNENVMSIAYESVQYTNGAIGKDSQPVAFTDPETGYDNSPSPFTVPQSNIYSGPSLLNPPTANEPALTRSSNTPATQSTTITETTQFDQTGNVYTVPKQDTQNTNAPVAPPAENTYETKDGARISRSLSSSAPASGTARKKAKSAARKSLAGKAINAGLLPYDNYVDFTKQVPSKADRESIIDSLVDKAASGDAKLANMASDAMQQNGIK
jgi:hypothetical protein